MKAFSKFFQTISFYISRISQFFVLYVVISILILLDKFLFLYYIIQLAKYG